MDTSYLKAKLPFATVDEDLLISTSKQNGLGYSLHVSEDGGLHYTLTSESGNYTSTYYADSMRELCVEAKTDIKSLAAISKRYSKLKTEELNDKLSIAAQSIVSSSNGDGSYKIVRENKMVSSYTELVKVSESEFYISRRIGLLPQRTVKLSNIETAMYLFLMNIEIIRATQAQITEIANWISSQISKLEERKVIPVRKVQLTKQNSWLGRTVKFDVSGKGAHPEEGTLLSLEMGTSVEIATPNGIIKVSKKNVWVD